MIFHHAQRGLHRWQWSAAELPSECKALLDEAAPRQTKTLYSTTMDLKIHRMVLRLKVVLKGIASQINLIMDASTI